MYQDKEGRKMISHIFYFLKGTVSKLSILSNSQLHVKEILKLSFYLILELNVCFFILFNIFKTLQIIIFSNRFLSFIRFRYQDT